MNINMNYILNNHKQYVCCSLEFRQTLVYINHLHSIEIPLKITTFATKRLHLGSGHCPEDGAQQTGRSAYQVSVPPNMPWMGNPTVLQKWVGKSEENHRNIWISGWWFGTFLFSPIFWMIQSDELIFFGGGVGLPWYTMQQLDMGVS
jgi:hypothetical protein